MIERHASWRFVIFWFTRSVRPRSISSSCAFDGSVEFAAIGFRTAASRSRGSRRLPLRSARRAHSRRQRCTRCSSRIGMNAHPVDLLRARAGRARPHEACIAAGSIVNSRCSMRRAMASASLPRPFRLVAQPRTSGRTSSPVVCASVQNRLDRGLRLAARPCASPSLQVRFDGASAAVRRAACSSSAMRAGRPATRPLRSGLPAVHGAAGASAASESTPALRQAIG